MSGLLDLLLDELAGDPVALERLRQLVGETLHRDEGFSAPAFTVATLAAELGRSQRSIRAAIARGELDAVKRGRGYVISADAVAEWARGGKNLTGEQPQTQARRARGGKKLTGRRSGPGPATRALRQEQVS